MEKKIFFTIASSIKLEKKILNNFYVKWVDKSAGVYGNFPSANNYHPFSRFKLIYSSICIIYAQISIVVPSGKVCYLNDA